ncbi:hypothetical protein F2P44_22135 [Massilia sp. CCM 8695]|uniref:Tox-GHH2 domain-containing protein n=1 Tax=Massilia frigida TaxID=2609281 RepID=A0ABX0NHK2_9BURK|nr:HNH/endonuclease VII fold toxin-2 domain-containing protein [Massilia frigida]NHZ81953.1 hypothetical protein [Massilia frigida]
MADSPAERLKAAREKRRRATSAETRQDNRRTRVVRPARYSPANTADFHYFDSRTMHPSCRKDKARIKDACNDKANAEEDSKKAAEGAKLNPTNVNGTTRSLSRELKKAATALDGAGKTRSGYVRNDKNKWMENHCGGLWNKPGGQYGPKGEKVNNTEGFKQQIKDKVGELSKLADDAKGAAMGKLENFAKNYFKDHADDILESAAEKAAKRAAFVKGSPVVAKAFSRLSMWETLGHVIGNAAGAIMTNDIETKFQAVSKAAFDAVEKAAEYQRILAPGGLEDVMASTMAGIAFANPCIKARKCLLVPYDQSGETDKGKGCCPGQTGHHVLPKAMFNKYTQETVDGKPKMVEGGLRDCWKDYNQKKALTICLEGTTNRAANGSHGMAHAGTAALMQRHRTSTDMPYTTARDEISTMLAQAYGCDPNCLKAQLDESMKDEHSCGPLKGAQVSPHSGESRGGPDVIDLPNLPSL